MASDMWADVLPISHIMYILYIYIYTICIAVISVGYRWQQRSQSQCTGPPLKQELAERKVGYDALECNKRRRLRCFACDIFGYELMPLPWWYNFWPSLHQPLLHLSHKQSSDTGSWAASASRLTWRQSHTLNHGMCVCVWMYLCLFFYSFISFHVMSFHFIHSVIGLSIYLSVCLSVYLSIYLCIYRLSSYLAISLSIYLSIYLSISLSLSIYLSIYLSLSLYLPTYLPACLPAYLPTYLPISLQYLSMYVCVSIVITQEDSLEHLPTMFKSSKSDPSIVSKQAFSGSSICIRIIIRWQISAWPAPLNLRVWKPKQTTLPNQNRNGMRNRQVDSAELGTGHCSPHAASQRGR